MDGVAARVNAAPPTRAVRNDTTNPAPLAPVPSNQPDPAPAAPHAEAVQGICHACFAFDVAFAINLNEAERAIAANGRRAVIQKKKRAPQSAQGPTVPLSINMASEPLTLHGFETEASVDVVLFAFGAASVRFTIRLDHSLEQLVGLSDALYDNATLGQRAKEHVEHTLAALGSAVTKPRIAPPIEDYVIFELDEHARESAEQFIAHRRTTVARLLRAEREQLSQQEVDDALTQSIAYGSSDRAVIDWHAALLIGPDAVDVRSILEYANVQLVQMRSLDDELEQTLDSSYEVLARFKGWRQSLLGIGSGELRRLGMLHADSAILFEGVTHSMKLVGDQYLARVYRAVSQRFHLPQWGANINRKLQTIDTIYEKTTDRQTTLRMEVLEWIIIILILIEVVKGFWPA